MKKYLHLPTHRKYGWLIFILGFVVTGLISIVLPLPYMLFGVIQWAFAIAFVIEIIAIITGKNKTV